MVAVVLTDAAPAVRRTGADAVRPAFKTVLRSVSLTAVILATVRWAVERAVRSVVWKMPIHRFAAFSDYWLERDLEQHARRVEGDIGLLDADLVLSSTDAELLATIVRERKPNPPRLDVENATTSKVSRYVPDRWRHGAQSSTQIFVVRIPYAGDLRFLRCYARERPRPMDTQEFFFEDGALCFESWPDINELDKLQRETREHFDYIRKQLLPLLPIAERFNATFEDRVLKAIRGRRVHVAERRCE